MPLGDAAHRTSVEDVYCSANSTWPAKEFFFFTIHLQIDGGAATGCMTECIFECMTDEEKEKMQYKLAAATNEITCATSASAVSLLTNLL